MANYRKHTIRYGDTVQSISQRHFGTVEEWRRIVRYNNLVYPYIVGSSEEKKKNPESLVTVGDTITIPIETSFMDRAVDDFGRKDRELIMSLALGRDLSITANENFFNTRGTSDEILEMSASNKGDLRTTIGAENLKQALIARLLTPMGSLLMHPDYGSNLHQMFGRATVEQARLIEIEVLSTIKKDGRVRDARAVESYIYGDTYYGEYEVDIQSIDEQLRIIMESSPDGNFVLR